MSYLLWAGAAGYLVGGFHGAALAVVVIGAIIFLFGLFLPC